MAASVPGRGVMSKVTDFQQRELAAAPSAAGSAALIMASSPVWTAVIAKLRSSRYEPGQVVDLLGIVGQPFRQQIGDRPPRQVAHHNVGDAAIFPDIIHRQNIE